MVRTTKIKKQLKKLLGRDPTPNEEENAKKDPAIIINILEDEIADIKSQLVILEQKIISLEKL